MYVLLLSGFGKSFPIGSCDFTVFDEGGYLNYACKFAGDAGMLLFANKPPTCHLRGRVEIFVFSIDADCVVESKIC